MYNFFYLCHMPKNACSAISKYIGSYHVETVPENHGWMLCTFKVQGEKLSAEITYAVFGAYLFV